ncbi:trichohyalin-like isoform X3 [Haplochromis burtoni]|uniref:trichohyalin-like isoform X3 n=1 Tax=Haplochromis burtoni TaxID=8153 RepID=UPI001C2DCFFC|nr:trichohyalin-like isoform X3 [Haplochromis burtoni]
MPSVQYLREFINERLTAAAEQIFLEFEKTIVQYEEEIDRQRRLLDITWKPQIKLHRTDVPQQQVCEEEEEVLPEQQLWNQERSSSVEQEEPEASQIKEEEEELCSSQQGEQLGLKEEPEVHNDPVQYEEEMERQRRLLDITWKPQIKRTGQTSHSSLSVRKRRRRFSLSSSSGTRRGAPVWSRRNQKLHRLKRKRRNCAAVRRESSWD